jgi:hypothetical protein
MIEDFVSNLTPGQAILCLLGSFWLACLVRKYQVRWQISRLGAKAPQIQFRLPYGAFIL